MSNITKEGIEVKPGQVWEDLDKRSNGRKVKVDSVENGKAHVRRWIRFGFSSHRTTKLSIRRMHKHSTGWRLVQ